MFCKDLLIGCHPLCPMPFRQAARSQLISCIISGSL